MLSKRFYLKRKRLSSVKVVLSTKNEYGSSALVLSTKNEYGSSALFLYSLIKLI